MIDTSKPMEILTTNGHWVPARFLAMTSAGTVVLERDGPYGVMVSQFAPESLSIRNKPEPKRRPLNNEELAAMVGTTLLWKSSPYLVIGFSGDTLFIGPARDGYDADHLKASDWRRLDGSGLWVEE